jgi:hypothetical protein
MRRIVPRNRLYGSGEFRFTFSLLACSILYSEPCIATLRQEIARQQTSSGKIQPTKSCERIMHKLSWYWDPRKISKQESADPRCGAISLSTLGNLGLAFDAAPFGDIRQRQTPFLSTSLATLFSEDLDPRAAHKWIGRPGDRSRL